MVMKSLLIALLLLISSATAFAEDKKPAVLQMNPPPTQERIETDIGMTTIHTHAAAIRIACLPFLAPLPYSYPRTTQEIPNALVLTGTQIPQRPHSRETAMR